MEEIQFNNRESIVNNNYKVNDLNNGYSTQNPRKEEISNGNKHKNIIGDKVIDMKEVRIENMEVSNGIKETMNSGIG